MGKAVDTIAKPAGNGFPAPPAQAATLLLQRGGGVPAAMLEDARIGVLTSGVLRSDLNRGGGRSSVLDFVFPAQFIVSCLRLPAGEAATITYVAVEDCTILIWNRAVIEAISGEAGWLALRQRHAEQALARSSHRLFSLLTMDARGRYAALQREFPEAQRRLPQHMLASYLGITPQYLCRLKGETAEQR